MSVILNAVFPVFFIILLGYIFKRKQFPGDEFWPYAEKITYYFFLPVLLAKSIAVADFSNAKDLIPLSVASVATMLAMSAIMFALRPLIKMDGKSFASFYQGGIRFNNYIGIPIVFGLYLHEGVALYALVIAVAIPVTNVLAVAVFCHYASETPMNLRRLGWQIITNPLVLSSLVGILINVLEIPLFALEEAGDIIAKGTIALGLLCVGAGTDPHAIRGNKLILLVCCLVKLVISPAIIIGICLLMEIRGMPMDVAAIYAGLPAATSSYIMAKQFGANAPLMAAITVVLTMVSAITLPLVVAVSQSFH
jgi:predicted permease